MKNISAEFKIEFNFEIELLEKTCTFQNCCNLDREEKRIKSLLENREFLQAVLFIENLIPKCLTEFHNEISLFKNQIKEIHRKIRLGITTPEEANISIHRLHLNILEFYQNFKDTCCNKV